MVSTRRGTVVTPAAAEEPARGKARADVDADGGGGRENSDQGMGMGMGTANPATLEERGKTGAEARPEACASETMARKEASRHSCEVREHRTPPPEGRGGVQTRARKRSARLARNASSPTATGKTSTRARTASPPAAKAPRVQHKTSKAVVTPLHETNRKFALRKRQQAGPAMKKPPQGVLKKSPALASSASSSSRSSRAKAGRTSVLSLSTSLAENGVGSETRRRVSSRLLPSSKRRRVEFSSVEVHEMHMTIGESSVPNDGGPPIGISPRLKRSIIHNLDSFEAERLTGRRSADSVGSPLQQRISQERYKVEGRLPAALRREMLVRVAAEEEFIARAEAESQEIQRHREHTNMVDPFDTFFPGAFSDEPATYAGSGEYAVSGTEAVEREVTSGRKFFGVADLF